MVDFTKFFQNKRSRRFWTMLTYWISPIFFFFQNKKVEDFRQCLISRNFFQNKRKKILGSTYLISCNFLKKSRRFEAMVDFTKLLQKRKTVEDFR